MELLSCLQPIKQSLNVISQEAAVCIMRLDACNNNNKRITHLISLFS